MYKDEAQTAMDREGYRVHNFDINVNIIIDSEIEMMDLQFSSHVAMSSFNLINHNTLLFLLPPFQHFAAPHFDHPFPDIVDDISPQARTAWLFLIQWRLALNTVAALP